MFNFFKKNLIVVFAKNNKVFKKFDYSFFYDICIISSSRLEGKSKCKFYFELKEEDRYKILSKVLKNIDCDKYNHIWITDQDVVISKNDLFKMFSIAEKYDLTVSQPSVSSKILNYNFMYKKENYIFRIVSFLDMRSPLFKSKNIKEIFHLFDNGGIGLEWIIPKFFNYEKVAIIDEIEVKYELPQDTYEHVENVIILNKKLNIKKIQPLFIEFSSLKKDSLIEKDRTFTIKNEINKKFKRPNRRENNCLKKTYNLSNRIMNFS